MGQNYRFANLLPLNIGRANYWLERAAEGGHAEAQHHLAWYYETGQYDYSINPTEATVAPTIVNGIVGLAASSPLCPWSITNPPDWITFPAGTNGAGSAVIAYRVAANPVCIPRTGMVSIASCMRARFHAPASGLRRHRIHARTHGGD